MQHWRLGQMQPSLWRGWAVGGENSGSPSRPYDRTAPPLRGLQRSHLHAGPSFLRTAGRSPARPARLPIRPPHRTSPASDPALAPIGPPATPAAVCLGFQAVHWSARVLPGSLKKKKKKFYGRMEEAGAAPGKGRAGATAAGGREGRRAGCAAEPGPSVPCSVPGCRHDGE